jgi:hypothetical protein
VRVYPSLTTQIQELERAVHALQAEVARREDALAKEQADKAVLALELQAAEEAKAKLQAHDSEQDAVLREVK